MKRILKIKLKLLLSNAILASIFILYISKFIETSSSLKELANSETKQQIRISDIKPKSVKLTNLNQIASVNSNNNSNEQISNTLIGRPILTIENRSRTKRQNLPEEFAPLISHQNSPHYEKLMLLDLNPVDESESDSLTSQTTTTSSTSTKPGKGKRTLYACEEKQLQIECQLGESIQLIRANYGRFSIQICNEHGQLDWKVNCMSPASFQIIANSCQAKQSCQLLASNSIFGDSCPGTQKYLEVHYQCVSANQLANNRTTASSFDGTGATISKQQQQPAQVTFPTQTAQNPSQRPNNNNKNVIPQPANSERNPMLLDNAAFGRHPAISGSQPQLPNWMVEVPLQPQPLPPPQPPLAPRFNSSRPHCPETVRRYLRWPATEAGQVVQMLCPAQARSSNPLESDAASFTCLQNGQWSARVQAARCQSSWLRNLTKLLEVGDSPLSILSELVRETRPPATPLLVNWPVNMAPATISNSALVTQAPSLFGDDLIQVARIVRRLVEEMVEFLNRMNDDKQRLAFAREMVQYLVELVNNLAHEHQMDAWFDLAPISGERQRVSGQFVQAIEAASVLLAGVTSQQAHLINTYSQQQQQSEEDGPNEDFVKLSENVYVTIRSIPTSSSNSQNRSIKFSFPSETSTLGSWWMNNEQRFTLHLQVAPNGNSASLEQSQVDVKYPQQQQAEQSGEQVGAQTLKIVFVMIKGLGSQMEPKNIASDIIPNDSGFVDKNKQRMIVNSNLVSLTLVADPRFRPVKVDLSSPIELVFKHLFPTHSNGAVENSIANQINRAVRASNPPRCVYWDNNISDWLSDGCKLVATNRTHSTCACNHLTTFALLGEWSSLAVEQDNNNQPTTSGSPLDGELFVEDQQQPHQQPKLQLDSSVENALILPNKLLYLAKMLDGNLFGNADQQTMNGLSEQQQANDCKLLIYVSCLISATLLALQLAAAGYNKTHARRLLGAIPAHPPPPLLVTNLRSANSATTGRVPSSHLTYHGQPRTISANCSDQTSPTYSSSDYSVALQASKIKLEQQQQRQFNAHPSGQLSFPTMSSGGISQGLKQLTFPIHLIVQLFILELLIVLLVESQNYLERKTPRNDHLHNSTTWSWRNAQFILAGFVASVPPSDQLSPIGLITWLLVITLYYLIAAILCWLAGQLIKLNVSLVKQHWHFKQLSGYSCSPSTSIGSSTEASDKSIHYVAADSTAVSSSVNPVSASICSQQQQQQRLPVAANNFYGPNSCYGQYNNNNSTAQQQMHHLNNLHSSTSPTSSFSSTGNQSMSDPNTALSRLEVESTRLYGETPRFGVASTNVGQPTSNKLHQDTKSNLYKNNQSLIATLPLDKLYLFVIHVLPVALVIVIALLSASKIELLNASYFTTNFSFQIAYWPLLVELTSTQLSILLYYEPAICLILAGFAFFILRSAYSWRQVTQNGGPISGYAAGKQTLAVVNPYGSSTMNINNNNSPHFQQQHISTTNSFLGSNSQQQMVLNKQSEGQNGLEFRANWLQMADFSHTNGDLKRAKFLCTMLLAILALHSICWISFFAHIHQALNSPPPMSSWPQLQQPQPRHWLKLSSNHLTYAFALSNLTLTILVSWWQRKTLRRAAQLSGIARFICTSSGDRSRKHASRFYRSHQTSPNGGATLSNGNGQVKVSPSSQSLFIVSQQQQLQPQQSSYHYGPSYSTAGSHQVSQHLYQQLSNQQHIYDSTSAINLAGNEQHHRFNMLLQQQQQQRHLHQMHQQDAFTLNRSLHQQQRQFAQIEQRQLMTLKPTSMTQPSHPDSSAQLLILDANQALKQQQDFNACQGNKTAYLDRSGEAEGPLVAFTSSSTSSGAASNNSSDASTSNNNNNQVPVTFGPNNSVAAHHHRQIQPASKHQHNNFQPNSEHQLFSQQQDQSAMASPAINCISGGGGSSSNCEQQQTRHSVTIRTSAADANQHQYCSINNPVGGKNYTDALKAALLEQQQNESSLLSSQQHFRSRLDANNSQLPSIAAGQTISGAKHNHNNFNNNHHHHQQQQQLALLRHQADASNIYDVALNH